MKRKASVDLLPDITSALPEGWAFRGSCDRPLSSILVDRTLLTLGLSVHSICAPVREQPIQERQPSAVPLMLSAAITLMADVLPPVPRQALIDTARTLRIHPENFCKSRPVLSQFVWHGMHARIVRDGTGQRAFILGSPAQLSAHCPLILDERPRSLEPADAEAISQAQGQFAFATADVTGDDLTDVTYLGCVHLMPAVNTVLLDALTQLTQEGYVVASCPSDDGQEPEEAALYVSMTGAPSPCLIPPAADDPRLPEAVYALHALLPPPKKHKPVPRSSLRNRPLWLALGASLLALDALLLIALIPRPIPPLVLLLICTGLVTYCGWWSVKKLFMPRWLTAVSCLPLVVLILAMALLGTLLGYTLGIPCILAGMLTGIPFVLALIAPR